MATRKHNKTDELGPVRVRGMFRVQIEDEDGTISGDSGWVGNVITNNGFQFAIAGPLLATTGSSLISYAALGSGTTCVSTDTALQSEILGTNGVVHRVTLASAASAPGGATKTAMQFTGTFNSTASFITSTGNLTLNNVGLFGHSTQSSMVAGSTYATSTCGSNQNVNLTYQINFQ